MNLPTILLIATVSVLALECRETPTNPGQTSHARVFLESERLNNAWGYFHQGWVIDTAGNIISYDIARDGAHWYGNESGYYTAEELWSKIHHLDTVRGFIPADTMEILRTLAAASVAGTYSDTTWPMRDAGAWTYSCYVYDPDSAKYRQVVLRVWGDCQFFNTAQSAMTLSTWMDKR